MPSVPLLNDSTVTVSYREHVTADSLLGDIRRADIPLHRANTLVAAIRLRASSLLWDAPGMPSDTAQHRAAVLLPCNINVTVPINHEVSQYNGFAFVHPPAEESEGPFYLVTRGRLVGIISQWIHAAPVVLHVKGAVCVKVGSMERAFELLLDAIDDNAVLYLK